MKRIITLFALASSLVFSGALLADDHAARPDHFEGLPAANIIAALENLAEYTEKLASLHDAPPDANEMAQVHILSYTIDNALERILEDVEDIAETLEEVHVASETMDRETVQKRGTVYLDASQALVKDQNTLA